MSGLTNEIMNKFLNIILTMNVDVCLADISMRSFEALSAVIED
jgi:hypothetical protein